LALRKGVKIEAINVRDYRLDLEELELILKTGKVKVFALTHMSNVLGTINPVAEITAMVRQLSPETIVVVDGAQFAPHYPVNVKALDVDFYAIAGHKMLGPTGVGVLYGKKVLLEQMDPVFVGGGMITKVELTKSEWENIPTKFEAGTPNIAQAIGLAEAVRFINKMGFPDINKHESELIDYFLAKVEDVKGLTVLGPNENKDRGAVFSFNIEGIHAHDLAQMLDEDDIAIRAGHHCNQVLLRDVLKVPATARASFYLYNDYKDIDKLVVGLEKAKKRLLRTVTT
jgi:cysteine desulfurase/selenocysteine lyase